MLWPCRSAWNTNEAPRMVTLRVVFSQAKSPPGVISTGVEVLLKGTTPAVEMW